MTDSVSGLISYTVTSGIVNLLTSPLRKLAYERTVWDSGIPTMKADPKRISYLGIWRSVRTDYGYAGLWKGYYIGVLRDIAYYLGKRGFNHAAPYLFSSHGDNNKKLNVLRVSAFGFFDATLDALLRYPFNLVEIKYLTQLDTVTGKTRFGSIFEVTRYVYDNEGLLGFYKGFSYLLIANLGFSALYTLMLAQVSKYVEEESEINLSLILVEALLMLVGILVSSPAEVVLSNIAALAGEKGETNYSEVLWKIYDKEGVWGWYRGFVARLLSVRDKPLSKISRGSGDLDTEGLGLRKSLSVRRSFYVS